MATKAVTAQGTKVGVDIPVTTSVSDGNGGTTTTTTMKRYWFQEVKSTPEIGETPNTIDVTHLGSDIHEYILDIPDQASNTLSFVMNCQPYDGSTTSTDGDKASNLAIMTNIMSKSKTYDFIILYPQDKIGFKQKAQWTWSMGAGSVGSAMELNLTLVPRGTPVPIYLNSSKYTVSYDANGGSGTMTDATEYGAGDEVTVKSNGFTAPTNMIFAAFNTRADGTGVSYDVGDTFDIFEDTKLYAIWVSEE